MLELIAIIFAAIMNFIASIILFIDIVKIEEKVWLISSYLFFLCGIFWFMILITKFGI